MRITKNRCVPARRFENRNRRVASFLAGTGIVIALSLAPLASAQAESFTAWVNGFWPTARAAGVRQSTYIRAFRGLTPNPSVIESAHYQPEYKVPIGDYVDRVCSNERVTTGQLMLLAHQHLFNALESRYGVDRHILVAIWAIESNFGSNAGDENVIRSLATLAYKGVKERYARRQLVAALQILQHGDISPQDMKGSWAGAMGKTQFIPTTYQAYAVDFDGNGKRDIWNSLPDALASTAHYLKASGWRPGQTWGYEVDVPRGFHVAAYGLKDFKSLAQWRRLGLVRVHGQPYPRPYDKAALYAPAGSHGPVFLVLHNFRVLLHYNQAPAYALSVGHLADLMMGYGPFSKPWPTDEDRLSFNQRRELQRRLVSEGLLDGDVDGVIGPATLKAVKAYQRKKGLAVDGFPSLTLLKMLRSET